MDPYAGLELQATTTCTANNGTFCTQYITQFPSNIVGDVVFCLGVLIFFAAFIFLGFFFNTFTKNQR